jgi:hypothetical protein
MKTVKVKALVQGQGGNPLPNVLVSAKLVREEVSQAGYALPDKKELKTGPDGIAEFDLFPNQEGYTGSMYEFKIHDPVTMRATKVYATVPSQDCWLHDIANLPAYDGKPDGQLSIDKVNAISLQIIDLRDNAASSATSAGNSAAAAAASEGRAASSSATASQKAADAAGSAGNAAASAATATQKAADAATSAGNAAASATTAAQKASDAGTSASNAYMNANAAANSAATATQKATDASNSAGAAATSAGTATQKASDAATSATAAGASATTATQKASEAAGSATAAASSATSAATGATTATTKAAEAAASATAAGNSATAAGTSAGNAAASATTAGQKATEAGSSATAAAGSASAAAGSATTATQKAVDAANSATAAANSATTSTQKAADAASSATAASASAGTAAQKATEAATSATAAANSAAQASANVLSTLLNGFSTASGTVVTNADTVISAIGKLQAQVAVRATLASPQFTGTVASAGGESFRAVGDTAYMSFFNTANAVRTGFVQGLAGSYLTLMAEGAAYAALGAGGNVSLKVMPSGNVTVSAADNGVDKLQVGGSLAATGPVKASAFTTNDYTRIVRPEGGFNRLNSSSLVTGAIGIALPVFYNYGMMMLRVRIYDYSSNTTHHLDIAGYAYAADSTWVNCSATYSGNTTKRFNVRFGNAGGKLAIWIGETTDVWGYTQVEVLDVLVGHSGASAAMTSGWSVTFGNTSFGNVVTVVATVNDAYTLQGYNASLAAVPNTVPVRDQNGHLYGNYLYSSYLNTSQPSEVSTVSYVFTNTGADGFLRKTPIGNFTSQLSGTAPISVTGTARGLTRSDSAPDAYNVQSWWDGTNWYLKGYNGTTFHAGVRVALADQATNAANATNATNANNIRVNDGSRDAATIKPNSAPNSVRFDFVTSATTGMGGNYSGVMTFTPYDGSTASTGDASYQLALGGTAANGGGVPQLRIRKGIDTAWNSWVAILTAADIPNYAPSLTGTGASGTWNITAVSANKLNGSAYTNGSDGWFRSSGAAGWYNETYSVGIYATEGGNVRTYNGANFISGGNLSAIGTVTGANLTGAMQAINLDAIKAPGLYHYDQAFTGTKPVASANFRTIEIGGADRYSQVAFPFDRNDMYFRRQTDSAFGPWVRVTTNMQAPITNKQWRYHPDDGANLNNAYSEHGFDYNTGSSGVVGPFVSFGALNVADNGVKSNYQCQLVASYSSSNFLKFRTQNGDTGGAWNPWRNIWHDGNLTSVSQLANDAKYRSAAAIYVSASALDSAVTPGDYMVDYGGYGAGMTVFAVGGSTGIVQQLFSYGGGFMFRNKTDSATWTPWKAVWHTGNSTTSGDPNAALVLDGNSTATMRSITLNQTDGVGAGIALYPAFSSGQPSYGIMFAKTANNGTHGAVNNDWATYFTMTGYHGRGWIFKNAETGTNVASISNAGAATFQQITVNNAGETFRSYGDNCYTTWYASNGVRQGYMQAIPGSAVVLATEAGNDFLVRTNGADRFRVNISGTATLAPSMDESLKIVRSGGYLSFYDTTNVARTGYLQYNAGGDVIMMGESPANGLVLGTNSQTRLYISKAGDVTANVSINSPLVTQTSDERKKENWKPIAPDLVRRLASIELAGTHEWKGGDGSRHCGIGAQSLAKVLPEAVYGKDELTVAYGSAAMVSAIALARELMQVREELKSISEELSNLKSK